jgi:hypothetical protein
MLSSSIVYADPLCLKTSYSIDPDKIRLCHNVDDIICKDVKKLERRGCNERDETILSKQMTKSEMYTFVGKCFTGVISSVEDFFTVFIPALLKGIWHVMRDASFKGAAEKTVGLFESTMSIASDIYEMAHEDPATFFQKQFAKMADIIGPSIAKYDCLKPEIKVEKICEVAAVLVIPPVLLAKVLVRGAVALKEMKVLSKFSKAVPATRYTMKVYGEMEKRLTNLGYSFAERDQLYNAGKMTPEFIATLKPISSAEGLAQKNMYIDAKLIAKEKAVAKNAAAATATATATATTTTVAAPKATTVAAQKATTVNPESPIPFQSDGNIYTVLKTPENIKIHIPANAIGYQSKYLEFPAKNSMGVMVSTPLEIESKMSDGRFVVRIFDKGTKTMEGKILTAEELRLLGVKEAPGLGKEIEAYKRQYKTYDPDEEI